VLPLLLIVFVIPLIGAVLGGAADSALAAAGIGITGVLAVAAVLVAVVVLVAVLRRRRAEEADTIRGHGSPTSTGSGSTRPTSPPNRPSRSPTPAQSPPGPATTGGRTLQTDPEDEGVRRLKERLAEAVSDLHDTVGAMPEPGDAKVRGLTSEQMIARAKERIRDWDKARDR
jgi:hypothetical protein